MHEITCLSTTETADILGVSGATVRNWCRAGHLEPYGKRPLSFALEEIKALEERIRTNRFNRLRKRANKSASNKVEINEPLEPAIGADLARLAETAREKALDQAQVLFLCALGLLRRAGELETPPQETVDLAAVSWRRPPLRDIMQNWLQRLGGKVRAVADPALDSFLDWKNCDDRLGLLYQGLSAEGRKSRAGAYLTPAGLIDDSLAMLGPAPASFLDPCCGTGRYLLRAAARFGMDPALLYGFDSDPVAVDIARINLLLFYPDLQFMPNVHCLDSLRDLANGSTDCSTNHLLGAIDAVATNPPWGGCKNRRRHRNLVALVKSGESFSLFLEKSLRLLRPGGRLSFILPEAMLKIKAHADIRKLLLDETRIRRISLLGRVFSGVFTPVMRIDLEKAAAPPGWQVEVVGRGKTHQAPQSRFTANASHAFDVAVTPRDEDLLARIYGVEHATLADNAEWALGIVTGDNSRCVLNAPAPGTEPVLRGRDVLKFAPRRPRCHIHFRPETFQQVAPERYFRAPEKLIYRFVSDNLVFAYDDRRTLTLNSANILIPRLPGISIRAALAFLNSRVFQYVFLKRFRTRKVLRGDLETLPFPLLTAKTTAELESRVQLCMTGEYEPAERLDRLVFSLFNLDDRDIAALEEGLASEAGNIFH